jgi:hypothetical protein
MHNKKSVLDINSKNKLFVIAGVCFLFSLLLILLSTGTYDPGDGVQHFLIAKYAFKYPLLLLDHWGKPIYTLFCMPFAQFGFIGSNVYNLLCNTATAFFACRLAQKMGFTHITACFILVFFSPLFFMTSFSGLTEPTFALILTASLLLIAYQRTAAAAVLISFLPFARTEGFFIIPVFVLYLMYHKQWKYILFTSTGSIVYSIAGYLALDDWLWIVHQNPYKGALDIYGKGPLLHFVAANDRLFGLPLVVLFLVGCLLLIVRGNKEKNFSSGMKLLIFGSFLTYFVMHSIFWWKGLFGSLGLHRVMAGVAPLFSLVALVGYQGINERLKRHKSVKTVAGAVILCTVIFWPLKQYRPPLEPNNEAELLMKTANWIKSNKVKTDRKVYCMYPMIGMLLNIDPFNASAYISTCMLQYPDFADNLKTGDIIFWDSHFGPECKITPLAIAGITGVKQLTQFQQADQSGKTFQVIVFSVVKD